MPRPSRTKLDPWIENMIISRGTEEEGSAGRLKAHVVGVGQMSQSQAQGSEGPTGLLFLSDGVVQIPAILTDSAWEHLQEQEDRECFSSLLNTTVYVQAYRLQFHMALEQTKCRFFLSVGELATTAAGPVRDSTPCCTSIPSVRMKIFKTWRALLGQEPPDTQMSQCGFELSELLGEWQHDCLRAALEDVRQRLTAARSPPTSPRPSTSSYDPSLPRNATGWDADRVRYKGEERLDIPVTHLIIPDEEAQGSRAQSSETPSETPSGLLVASEERMPDCPLASQPTETVQPFVDEFKWQTAAGAAGSPHVNANALLPQASLLNEDMSAGMIDCDAGPLSNPWDIFPPPCDVLSTSSSDESTNPDVMPRQCPLDPAAVESHTERAAVATSTQIPIRGSGNSQTSEQSKGEHSFLPPYQKPQPASSLAPTSGSSCSTSVSPPDSIATLNPSPATYGHCPHAAQRPDPVSDQDTRVVEKDAQEEEVAQGECRKAKLKRKRSERTPDAETTLEEEEEAVQTSWSPPSWLFETQAASRAEAGSGSNQGQAAGTVLRKIPTAHSDSTQFSYCYNVSGQSLQDLSKYKVPDDLLHWAVKYLVNPKQTNHDNPHKLVS